MCALVLSQFVLLVGVHFIQFPAVLAWFSVRFVVCDKCTEIDDHLHNATTEQERKLWLQSKSIHRRYVSTLCCASSAWVVCLGTFAVLVFRLELSRACTAFKVPMRLLLRTP